MWKNLRLRPILASVLVLAFMRGALAAGVSAASAETSLYNYAGHLTFTVNGCGPEELENFPLRIRLYEEMVHGFGADVFVNGTNDLVFVDSAGRALSYEIESWNASETTTFQAVLWVKVPRMRNGTAITMCWGLRDGCSQPAQNDPASVWSDYVGVWHMETPDDASPNHTHGETNVQAVVRSDGVFGGAYGMTTTGRKGPILTAAANDAINGLNGVGGFSVSLWLRLNTVNTDWGYLFSRMETDDKPQSWGAQFRGVNTDGKATLLTIRTKGEDGHKNQGAAYAFPISQWMKVDVLYSNSYVEYWVDGMRILHYDNPKAIGASTLDFSIGGLVGTTGHGTLNGDIDEFRLRPGTNTVSAAWIAAEVAQTNLDYCAAGNFTNDTKAVLQNGWAREPSVTKTVWEAGTYPTRDDFDIEPQHGTNVTVVVYDRSTGAVMASNELELVEFPRDPGSYRVYVTVAQSGSEKDGFWGALEYTLGYRIAKNAGSHEFNVNVARILLGNDDYTVDGGEVEWQGYDEEYPDSAGSWWRHLDADGNDASTTYADYWSDSFDFNLGGGTHHIYRHGDGIDRLWDLRDVRIGNTFHNGETLWERRKVEEQYAEGLESDQNYLPWNPDSQRVLNARWSPGDPVGGSHRYVGHIVMQNTTNAAVTSTCYTNGIGTIYFDAVNGWTDNVTNGNGEASYRLVVEIATNKVGTALPPTERYVSFNANPNISIEVADDSREPFYGADWVRWKDLRVLRFDGDYCEDLGTTNAVDLKITKGGTYESFYRVIVPVNLMPKTGGIRFRIRRETVVEDQRMLPDGTAYVLLDNLVCSEPAACVQLTPYGEYFPEKKRPTDVVQGWEGAFDPAFPSVTDAKVYGRAKATLPDGSAIPEGVVSAATMHYRWHYLEQQTTGWLEADLVPDTLVTRDPLALPPSFQGDVDFWFDAVQHGHYYVYADYSGTGLGLGGTGYSEEIPAVTNRAEGADWFVRLREGKSDYGELKLLVRETANANPVEFPLSVTQDGLWRGYYRMTNGVDGILWRIEARNRQENGATEWNWSTNRWYVTDWEETPPTFPAAGRMSEGTTNSWCRMTCDRQTGYLMFQVDETSLGVTAIHADYQAFDEWNDAAQGYFTGSSVDTNGMAGTSASVREYSASYATWADTPATNKNWALDFNSHTIDESALFKGYTTFADFNDYFMAWQLGKGMWVYGKYREPDSHIALQMAGNTEGHAEFSNRTILGDDWPRGLESVSFHSRIAQVVSPELMAYNMVGVWKEVETPQYAYRYVAPAMLLTNYTFMARTCFDMKKNEGFAGNASVSLFAYYTPGTGAYEARWEQVSGYMPPKGGDYDGETLGPKPRGQRLVISRWDSVGSTYTNVVLYSVDNTSFQGGFDMPTMPYVDGMTATNNLMPFLISVFKQGNDTIVLAGVRCSVKEQKGNNHGGVSWDRRVTEMTGSWYFACARDTSAKQLAGGAYGVLSANCEGLFLTPQWRDGITHPNDTQPAKLVTGYYSNKSLNSAKDYVDSRDEMKMGWWGMNRGRTETFYDAYDTRHPFGFSYVKPYQTVDVLVKPLDSKDTTWDVAKYRIGQVAVTDFGTPFKAPDHKPTFYYTTDSLLRLQTGGTLDSFRTDVVINDIEIRQWRGYDSSKDPSQTEREDHTNFVFTCGWITNGAAQLSAKRTPGGTPCSIRSPLLDGDYGNGMGLGSFRFSYREPQTNIHLLVQIATNLTNGSGDLKTLTYSTAEGTGNQSWHTVTNLYYADLWPSAPEKGDTRTWSQSFGYHGAKGLMRVVVDPALVEQVSDLAWQDTSAFGAIDITSVKCFDEPGLDRKCWWGWNLQVVGDQDDSQKRMYLPDGTWDIDYGQSLALNNSTTADVNPAEEAADFRKHVPFLQSPTFTNAVIGQISFKARKYENSDYAPDARVVVYGAPREESEDELSKDSAWSFIAEFPVTNTIYTTYTCKTDAQNYRALRLAVVLPRGATKDPPEEAKGVTNPQRVMIDEVTVCEAVRAMLAFRNVGAFRSDLNNNDYVTGVTTRVQQPLCDENWGVQAEVFATMLGDEIDKTYPPRVKLHWYVGTEPWGFAKWRKCETGSAWLSQTEGSNYVYRSSFKGSPDAVMPAQPTNTVVQYTLEVEYRTISTATPGGKPSKALATNWLDSTSWAVPEWYAPVDYNADPAYGAGRSFAAFNILDTVAPGWAWLNEMNTLGTLDDWGRNSEMDFQYVEICVPMEADLTGWRLRMLDLDLGKSEVTTNWVASFGSTFFDQAAGTKKNNMGAKYRKVFRCIGNKESDQLKKENGTLDGIWEFSEPTATFRTIDGVGYIYDEIQPIGVQLVRPTGIIESSIVVVGTNKNGRLPGYTEYDPTNVAARLNQLVPGSRFYYAAEDCCGTFRSGSVTKGRAESAGDWTNNWACSPGYINTNWGGKVEQKIDPDHPTPHGDSIVIYASVDLSGGPIRQWVGGWGSTHTNEAEVIVLQKGSERGTNIVYQVDPWYEIAPVTTNGAVFWYEPRKREREITFGVGASNNLTVVARAQVDSDLRDKYGLDEKNPFTPAVLDWLHRGSTMYGLFAHADGIGLAEYWDMSGTCVTNLTLTQMYCLDMDPTVSNLILKAGMMNAWPVIDQTQHATNVVPGYLGNDAQTNVRMQVFMMISNKVEGVTGPGELLRRAWAPYVLRGLDPDYTSWDYRKGGSATSRGWTSETFKVTGILANGLTQESNYEDWKPIRWFVFHEGSFAEDFTTSIEIEDPHSPSSQGYANWYDWFSDKDHPERAHTPVFNRWAIDMRSKPVEVEVLQPTNFFSSAASPQ